MQKFNSLAIGLLAVISIAPTAGAVAPINNAPQSAQPAGNLYAQVSINVGIGINPQPRPQQRVIVVESAPRPQPNVIIVETSNRGSESYRGRSSWAESRGRHEGYYKHGHSHGRGHSKHHGDRDDD
jgi:hypothetical protein